jgi:sterol 3beta-glucosyltransferase
MRITFVTPGSRGDVQPYVALGRGLIGAGYRVRLVSTENHSNFVASNGIDFWPIETSTEDIIRSEKMRAVMESGKLLISMAKLGGELKRNAELVTRRSLEACKDSSLIVAGIGGLFTGQSIAEKLNIPFVQAHNLPFTPTASFPGVLFPNFAKIPGGYRISHFLTRQLLWQAYRPTDKIAREQVLGLNTYPFMGPYGRKEFAESPIIYGLSSAVIPRPPDWADNIHLTGFWFLDSPDDLEPSEELKDFVDSGPPPVYIGFGSMSSRNPAETANIILEALRSTGERAILYSGWGGIEKSKASENVLSVNSAPHTWLFPRCLAVIHHGGAGTTAAGLRSGSPSIVIPHHADQLFWASLVEKLGVGSKPIPRKKLSAKRLAEAINEVKSNEEIQTNAARLGAQIDKEKGVKNAIDIIKKLM